LFVELFLEAHQHPPKQIILDLDATDDPLHGYQEGRFFHGYHDCYCYLPLYIFCGPHLLAKLRSADIDAAAGAVEKIARIVTQIRGRWPQVRIVMRADSGFACDELMGWCEANGVDFLHGLTRNERLVAETAAEAESQASGQPARRFKQFGVVRLTYRDRRSAKQDARSHCRHCITPFARRFGSKKSGALIARRDGVEG
jgi:Transposase DDE domain group 1